MGNGGEGMAHNYSVTLLGEVKIDSEKCYELELIPTDDNDSGYEKLLVYITKEKFTYAQIKYFKDNANIKTLSFSDYRDIEGVYYPFELIMKNHTKDSLSKITTTYIEFNSNKVKDSIFNQSYLKKIK